MAGPYRTGKSYLLNQLLGKCGSGFAVAATVQPCTKGLWVWGRPIKVSEDLHSLLIDSEGLNSCERGDQTIDMLIFTLAILLSSQFVYNSMTAIDENALEALSLVCNLSRSIHVTAKPQVIGEECSEYAAHFPSFMWVIRDFSL